METSDVGVVRQTARALLGGAKGIARALLTEERAMEPRPADDPAELRREVERLRAGVVAASVELEHAVATAGVLGRPVAVGDIADAREILDRLLARPPHPR